MNLHQLFKLQEIMEKNIREQSKIDEDSLGKDNVFHLRFLALQVKVGELANLTKCYKYSKVKEDIPKEKLMYRYIDAMKFLLSIGNINNFNIIDANSIISKYKEESIIKLFSYIYDDITNLKNLVMRDHYVDALNLYITLFARFINLGELLGFKFEEVYNYYLDMSASQNLMGNTNY